MVLQLPAVHRLLVLLPSLQQQYIDRTGVRDVAILLETFADGVPQVGWWHVECIERYYLGGLVSKGFEWAVEYME